MEEKPWSAYFGAHRRNITNDEILTAIAQGIYLLGVKLSTIADKIDEIEVGGGGTPSIDSGSGTTIVNEAVVIDEGEDIPSTLQDGGLLVVNEINQEPFKP